MQGRVGSASRLGSLGVPILFILHLGAAAGTAAVLRVPDPDRGIATIAQALAQSSPGDEIEIAEGRYRESLTLTTSSLTLRGVGDVVIDGIRVYTLPDPGMAYPGIVVRNAAAIRLESLHVYGGPPLSGVYGSSTTYPGAAAVVATSSTLTVVGCALLGRTGSQSPALLATSSRVRISESSLYGGSGYTLPGAFFGCHGTAGSEALRLERSCAQDTAAVWLTDSQTFGGRKGQPS